jgi:hypothetical protein
MAQRWMCRSARREALAAARGYFKAGATIILVCGVSGTAGGRVGYGVFFKVRKGNFHLVGG